MLSGKHSEYKSLNILGIIPLRRVYFLSYYIWLLQKTSIIFILYSISYKTSCETSPLTPRQKSLRNQINKKTPAASEGLLIFGG